jgi:hypothetical protein
MSKLFSAIDQPNGAIFMNNRLKSFLFLSTMLAFFVTGCRDGELQTRTQEALDRALNRGAHVVVTVPLNSNFGAGGDATVRVRGGPFIKPPDIKINIRDIQLSLQVIGGNASVTNGNATLALESGGNVAGSAVFAYSKVGDEIVFNQPDQVSAWINSFSVEIDGFDLTLNSIAITLPIVQGEIVVSQSVLGSEIKRQSFNVSNNGSGGILVSAPEQ